MDKKEAIKIAQEHKALVENNMPPKALYLYGPYSKGNQREDSDIDIAVIVERPAEEYFADTPLPWRLRRKGSNLREPILLTEDMENPLYRDIRKTGILI